MAESDTSLRTLLDAMASDMELLIRLHGKELEIDLFRELGSGSAASWFALTLDSADAKLGLSLLDDFFQDAKDLTSALDSLAVEYADFYLTFGKRVAPNESYWLTEDHIERQEPMFEVREWYAHYGLRAQDWRVQSDDHLVSELSFVAFLLRDGRDHALQDASRFLDKHLLRWSQDFFGGIVDRADSRFYAGVALVSEAMLQTVRSFLEQILGEERLIIARAPAASPEPADLSFAPGLAPSW